MMENSIDEIEKVLIQETDLSTKRNSFLLLFSVCQEKELAFIFGIMKGDEDSVSEMGDIF